MNYLGWTDYGVLVGLLGLSAGIGIYHGCIRSKQLSANEFLIANGRMKVLPTAMSLLASIMSAATVLGGPAEVYAYGTTYLYWISAWLIGGAITAQLFIPMFRRIGNISIYAYLEQRFSLSVRIVVTIVFIAINTSYMAVILYGPSLALSQVTGLNTWLAVLACGVICTFYTSIAGMKGVIYTDVVQTVMIALGIILSIIFGLIDAGGVRKVFDIAVAGNRIQMINATWSLSMRYTIWGAIIGGGLYALAAGSCLQTQTQRFMCVKSTRAAQKVAWLNSVMFSIMLVLCACVGCIIYAKYHQCDPLRAKLILKPDQLYPLFIIETLGRFPGFIGLFIASVLSASLSTISSGMNSIATVIIEDIYKRFVTGDVVSDRKQAIISKILSAVIGLLVIFLAFVASSLGDNILVIVFQISGSFSSPILGVYLLGFFAPRVNSRSVLVAFVLCLIFQTWVLMGASLTIGQHIGTSGRLPVSVQGCPSTVNYTRSIVTSVGPTNPLLPLYSMSVMWYAFNGVALTVIIGLLGSFIFRSDKSTAIDKSLLVSWRDIWHWRELEKKQSVPELDGSQATEAQAIERERML